MAVRCCLRTPSVLNCHRAPGVQKSPFFCRREETGTLLCQTLNSNRNGFLVGRPKRGTFFLWSSCVRSELAETILGLFKSSAETQYLKYLHVLYQERR